MQITYQLTPEDLVTVQRQLITPGPRGQRRFWRNLLIVPLVATLLALSAVQFDLWSNWFVAPLIFSLFWVVFYTRSYRRAPEQAIRQWLAAGQNASILSPRTVTLSDTELTETIGAQTTRVGWDGVAEIARNAEYMMIVLNPEKAITVPKRVFASAEAAEQFFTAALTYYAQARRADEATT